MHRQKLRIGIVGCGAIGSRIAQSVLNELKNYCQLTGLYDIDRQKVSELEQNLKIKKLGKSSLEELLDNCDLMVEAVNATSTRPIVEQALKLRRSVLAMSVGKLIDGQDLFQLAQKNRCQILLPSGAIAGIDAVKAASLVKIDKITLTTRKPPSGFVQNEYLTQKGIDLKKISRETVLFEGDVNSAVKIFPQNINVAATLAIASQAKNKLTVRIVTSNEFKTNSHEIELTGEFGKITTRTENVVCPDNPKTSYLAVLSGIQTLKQFCEGVIVGT